MSHMQAQMTEEQLWYEMEGDGGTGWVPVEDVGRRKSDQLTDALDMVQYLGEQVAEATTVPEAKKAAEYFLKFLQKIADRYEGAVVESVRVREGYGVRLSAPGYMDRTEWTVYCIREDAEKALAELRAEDK